jgi:DNA (cytosine-5)-methyltransferase 1
VTGVYFNEFDPGAAEWLRELMKAGLIPGGVVDERSIAEVRPDDLRGFHAVHLFAGIGGWPYALRLAGWPDDQPVWTGSCPCQPYSAAGKGLGDADPRNLWPAMFRLVRECRPVVCFGEQVEGAVRHGWLDRVSADLEGEGYAVGACVLGAHSVGAPHIRQRLYWVADSQPVEPWGREQGEQGPARFGRSGLADCGSPGRSAHADGREPGDGELQRGGQHGREPQDGGAGGGVVYADGERRPEYVGGPRAGEESDAADAGAGPGFWDRYDLIPCRDGKARRVEPGSFPLADGIPGRVGLLRGYGNAINPHTAAAFVRAWEEVRK